MEVDGQGGEAVPTPEDEPEELAALHPGHSAGYVPEVEADLFQVRGQHDELAHQRAF